MQCSNLGKDEDLTAENVEKYEKLYERYSELYEYFAKNNDVMEFLYDFKFEN